VSTLSAVHPFPARMAPELAHERVQTLAKHEVVLDPMMGSGTFVLAAAKAGVQAIGCDTDPLALIISAAAAGQFDIAAVRAARDEILSNAPRDPASFSFPDAETRDFAAFWFDADAADRLAALARGIQLAPYGVQAPLWCAFSRLIVTKDSGASLARDVSHSRPHRVREAASFDPVERFGAAVETVLRRVTLPEDADAPPLLFRADARALPLADSSVNAIMTSPPYLVAIDYLRGHRLSLIWMGYSVAELRSLRGTNIGSERGADIPQRLAHVVLESVRGVLSPRKTSILNRYVQDLDGVAREMARVLRPGGAAQFVVADPTHGEGGASVGTALTLLADQHGLVRMRTETVLSFEKQA
jgi:SAM-dependent methyltransferase